MTTMPMSGRFEIFPADLDPTVDFSTRVLDFRLVRDDRRAPDPYVALVRGSGYLGAVPSGYFLRLPSRS